LTGTAREPSTADAVLRIRDVAADVGEHLVRPHAGGATGGQDDRGDAHRSRDEELTAEDLSGEGLSGRDLEGWDLGGGDLSVGEPGSDDLEVRIRVVRRAAGDGS